METHKPVSDTIEPPKKSPVLLIVAVLALAVSIAGAFYLGLQKSAIQEEQKRLDADITALRQEIEALQSQKIEAAQLAQKWLEEVKKSEILWSRVITRIQSLLPVDAVTQAQKIKILSYSGSQGGKLSLNAQTVPSQIEPYPDVAELISVFNVSSFFADAYVPTITRGETETGEKLLSFIFNLAYREEEPEAISFATDGGEPAAEEKPKVPRQPTQ